MSRTKRARTSAATRTRLRGAKSPFPIVGIGASAGGLEAFTELLKALPSDTGMAFVFVQHLDPAHTSILPEALAKRTRMPVHEVRDGMEVLPDHVYVIPPNADLGLLRGVLTLLPRHRVEGQPHLSIDLFFRSLAAERGENAIGVVLSGTGSDGTLGLKSIKEAQGVSFAQDPASAKFPPMPDSAVRAGVADLVLAPPAIAAELGRLGRHPYFRPPPSERRAEEDGDEADLKKVLLLVRDRTGTDFTEYKQPTIRRRLARRMALHRLATLRDYLAFLQETPDEARALFDDFLIHVTSFFRDPQAFEVLKTRVLAEILRVRTDVPVRIWATGCATGEEAYSLAIAYLEVATELGSRRPLHVFGGDLSERAIEKARAGFYLEGSLHDVSPERLRRWFTKVDGGYRIAKSVRDLCVFSRHDLARDPPFSRLDLISCRNVLIYFDLPLQRRLAESFHYCLNQPGFLMIGRNESVHLGAGFSVVDKTARILARTPGLGPAHALRARDTHPQHRARIAQPPALHVAAEVVQQVDQLLLGRYAPPGVVVDEQLQVLQFRGRTGPWLEHPPGSPQMHLLKMAREGLLAELRLALSQARRKGTPVRRESVRVDADGSARACDLVVLPVKIRGEAGTEERVFAVLFEERRAAPVAESPRSSGRGPSRIEKELIATREYLHSLLDEHQHANEELGAANEELLSGNEELQSLNEELETAKEELQSGNEELNTVNEELQSRNAELGQVNNDLLNILRSVEIPILILDAEHRIRRFTPKARSIMNLLPGDVGRSIEDIRLNISGTNLDELVREVIDSVAIREVEVQDRAGRWHRMQVRPYRTTDNKIDGVVLTLVDIDVLKDAVKKAEWARDYARDIVEAVPIPLLVLDAKIAILSANEAFYRTFHAQRDATEGTSLYEVAGGYWATDEIKALFENLLPASHAFHGVEVRRTLPGDGEMRVFSLSARPVVHAGEKMPMIVLAIEDVTDRRRAEAERTELLAQSQAARAEAEAANRAKDLFLAMLSHELRTPLNTLLMAAQVLTRQGISPTQLEHTAKAIERAARTQAQLIEDLLDISRIVAGKLKIDRKPIDLAPVIQAAVDANEPLAHAKSIRVEVRLDRATPRVNGDAVRLQQVVSNLLTNSLKFTPDQGRIAIRLAPADGGVRLTVRDSGIGIEPAFLPKVFDRFAQAESSSTTRSHGGLGLGLAIVRHLVELHQGTVRVESEGKDKGSTFTVVLPPLEDAGAEAGSNGARRGAPRPARRRALHHRGGMHGFRILLVEDDADSREAVSTVLRAEGAEVTTAGSVPEAMASFSEHHPQLLLLDIGLPGEDGYSLLERIRARGPRRGGSVPAIAMTAFAGAEDKRRAMSAGFQLHLAKPLSIGALVDAVSEFARHGR